MTTTQRLSASALILVLLSGCTTTSDGHGHYVAHWGLDPSWHAGECEGHLLSEYDSEQTKVCQASEQEAQRGGISATGGVLEGLLMLLLRR
jgi:hypothetical protein